MCKESKVIGIVMRLQFVRLMGYMMRCCQNVTVIEVAAQTQIFINMPSIASHVGKDTCQILIA